LMWMTTEIGEVDVEVEQECIIGVRITYCMEGVICHRIDFTFVSLLVCMVFVFFS